MQLTGRLMLVEAVKTLALVGDLANGLNEADPRKDDCIANCGCAT